MIAGGTGTFTFLLLIYGILAILLVIIFVRLRIPKLTTAGCSQANTIDAIDLINLEMITPCHGIRLEINRWM